MAEYPEIIRAIWRDDLGAVKKLASNPDVIDSDGRTPLMAAAIEGKTAAAKILIECGANLDTRDPDGWSALHFAAQSKSADFVELLIKAGAQIDPIDSFGNSPLWRATFESKGEGQVIALLRSFGADPTLKNTAGVSPVDLAKTIGNYDVAQFYDDLSA